MSKAAKLFGNRDIIQKIEVTRTLFGNTNNTEPPPKSEIAASHSHNLS